MSKPLILEHNELLKNLITIEDIENQNGNRRTGRSFYWLAIGKN